MKITRRQLRRLIMEQMSVPELPGGGGAAGYAKGEYPPHIETEQQKRMYDLYKAPERRKAKHGEADPEFFANLINDTLQSIPLVGTTITALNLVDKIIEIYELYQKGKDKEAEKQIKEMAIDAGWGFIPGGKFAQRIKKHTGPVTEKLFDEVVALLDSEAKEAVKKAAT